MDREDDQAATSRSRREVIVDGKGLVTLCPNLGYYDVPPGAAGAGAARTSVDFGSPGGRVLSEALGAVPSMQVRQTL